MHIFMQEIKTTFSVQIVFYSVRKKVMESSNASIVALTYIIQLI